MLVATGRVSNADSLDLSPTRVEVDDNGLVRVDQYQRTTPEGLGRGAMSVRPSSSSTSPTTRPGVVQRNLLHRVDLRASDHRFVPQAGFSGPQVVGSVGLSEQACRQQGLRHAVAFGRHAVAFGRHAVAFGRLAGTFDWVERRHRGIQLGGALR